MGAESTAKRWVRRSHSELPGATALAIARPSWAPQDWDPRAAAVAAKAQMAANTNNSSAGRSATPDGSGAPAQPRVDEGTVTTAQEPTEIVPSSINDSRPAGANPCAAAAAEQAHKLGAGTGVFIPLAGATNVAKGRHNKSVRAAAAASAAATRALSTAPRCSLDGTAPPHAGDAPARDTHFPSDSEHQQAAARLPQRRATFSCGAGPTYPPAASPTTAPGQQQQQQQMHVICGLPGSHSPTPGYCGSAFASSQVSPSAFAPFTSSPANIGPSALLSGPCVSTEFSFLSSQMNDLGLGGLGGAGLSTASLPAPLDCSGAGVGVFDISLSQRLCRAPTPAASGRMATPPPEPAPAQAQGAPAAQAAAVAAAQAALQAATAALAVAQQAAASGAAPPGGAGAQVAAAAELLQQAQLLQQQVAFQGKQQADERQQQQMWEQLQVQLSTSCIGLQDSAGSNAFVCADMLGTAATAPVNMLDGFSYASGHALSGPALRLASEPGHLLVQLQPQMADQAALGLGSFSLWPSPGSPGDGQARPQQPPRGGLQLQRGAGQPQRLPRQPEGDEGDMSLEQLVALQELSALLSTGPRQ